MVLLFPCSGNKKAGANGRPWFQCRCADPRPGEDCWSCYQGACQDREPKPCPALPAASLPSPSCALHPPWHRARRRGAQKKTAPQRAPSWLSWLSAYTMTRRPPVQGRLLPRPVLRTSWKSRIMDPVYEGRVCASMRLPRAASRDHGTGLWPIAVPASGPLRARSDTCRKGDWTGGWKSVYFLDILYLSYGVEGEALR